MKRDILLVDDDKNMQELAKFFFEQAGYSLQVAGDGISALQQMGEKQYDLIVLDLSMPYMNGLKVLKIVRAYERFRNIPIIMLTASNDSDDIKSIMRYGVTDYVLKPPRREDLLARVERVLGGRPQFEQITFSKEESIAQGSLDIPIQVKSVSSQGAVVHSPVPVDKAFLIETMNLNFMAAMEVRECNFVVVDCLKAEEGGYEYFLAFSGLSRAEQEKITSWVVTQTLARKTKRAISK